MIRKDSPTITMGTGPLYLIPLKVCNIRARTVTVSGACLALTLHTEQGVFGTLLPYMCPQQYSTILASLFQTEVFA